VPSFLILCLFGCGTSDTANSTPARTPTKPVPTLSGKPIVGYRLKHPRWPVKAACGTVPMNVILERPVNEQELIDLALDLHARYPHTYFEILDDESRLRDFDQELDLANAEQRLGVSGVKALLASLKPWEQKHYLATIMLEAENNTFTWILEGADGHPTMANERICDLDAKTMSTPECVAAAADPHDNQR